MRAFFNRLGAKLVLTTLILVTLLATVTAALVTLGFRQTQSNAVQRSRQGLETQGRVSLLQLTQREAQLGAAQLQQAAALSRAAADYLAAMRRLGGQLPWDGSRVAQGPDGQRFDANPARRTEVWIGGDVTLDAAVERDLRESAVLDALFPTLLAQYPEATSIYFVSPRGVGRYYPRLDLAGILPPGFRPVDEPFFALAAPDENPGRDTVWTLAAADYAGQGPVVTASTPVYDGDQFLGVIGVDVSLMRLIERLNSLRPTAAGFAFLVDRDGRLIAAPAEAIPAITGQEDGQPSPPITDTFGLALTASSNAGFLQTLAAMRAGDSGLVEIELGGRPALLSYAPLPAAGWSLGLVAPLGEITAPSEAVAAAIEQDANATIRTTLLATAGIFLLALSATVLMSRYALTGPLETLLGAMQAVAAGNLGVTIPVTSGDELGRLARSFNRMTGELAAVQQRLEVRTRELVRLNRTLRGEIAEREQAEASLTEKERQYRSIFEATSDGLVINDPEGTVVEANPAFCRMHGYAYQEVIGLNPTTFIHPDYHSVFTNYVQTVKGGGQFQAQAIDLRKDGSQFHVEVHGTPFTYKGKPHLLGVVRDVTERVLAQQMLEQRVEDRTRELSALFDVTAVASASLDLETVLERSLERVLEVMGCEVGAIHLLDEKKEGLHLAARRQAAGAAGIDAGAGDAEALGAGLAAQVIEQGEPLVVPNLADSPLALPAVRAYVGVPMRAKGRVLGVLSVVGETGRQFSVDAQRVALLASIADQVGVAVENARLYQQAEQLAVMEERQRLARELHDSVTQSLYSVTLLAETGRRSVAGGELGQLKGYLDRLGEIARQALKEMRLLVYELRPAALEQDGLVGALQRRLDAVEGRAGVEARLLLETEAELAAPVEEALYRIAQEALNNVLKHAAATAVTVCIRAGAGEVTLEVEDNGRGFDLEAAAKQGGLGLISMRERAERLGGSLIITTAPGEGTKVVANIRREGHR